MNEGQVDRLIDLAETVGGKAWPLLVKSNFVGGIVTLTWFVLVTVVFLSASRLAWRYKTSRDLDWDDVLPLTLPFGIVALLLAGLWFIGGYEAVYAIVCPECAAIQDLVPK